jgi:protein AaeX
MTFAEIDLFGVYVAPLSVLLIAAWLVTTALRRIANRIGLLQLAWHPGLFVFALYTIVLASMTLVAARWFHHVLA